MDLWVRLCSWISADVRWLILSIILSLNMPLVAKLIIFVYS